MHTRYSFLSTSLRLAELMARSLCCRFFSILLQDLKRILFDEQGVQISFFSTSIEISRKSTFRDRESLKIQ